MAVEPGMHARRGVCDQKQFARALARCLYKTRHMTRRRPQILLQRIMTLVERLQPAPEYTGLVGGVPAPEYAHATN
jgi:hypothetical protein